MNVLKQTKYPLDFLHVEETPSNISPNRYDTVELVTEAFKDLAKKEGTYPAYKIFAIRSFRENLSIPDKIWAELEPMIKEKINAIRKKVRLESEQKQGSITTNKIPNQYPNAKPKGHYDKYGNLIGRLSPG